MSIDTSLHASAGLNIDESPIALFPERRKLNALILFLLWVAVAALPLMDGLAYYLTPLTERPFTDLHDSYKPSGLVGQGLGILGTLMMVIGVSSYMLRKRVGFLQKFGKLRHWLTFHIFLCTLGPFLVLLHTTFRFGNIASISFWSMAIVVGSGIFGRYVYVRIPKTMNGEFLSPQLVKQARHNLMQRLTKMTAVPVDQLAAMMPVSKPSGSILGAVSRSFMFEFRKRALRQRFDAGLAKLEVAAETRDEAADLLMGQAHLQMRMQVMQPFVRAFGYWHVLHIPLALVMLAALVIHVGVAIAFGYTWIW